MGNPEAQLELPIKGVSSVVIIPTSALRLRSGPINVATALGRQQSISVAVKRRLAWTETDGRNLDAATGTQHLQIVSL